MTHQMLSNDCQWICAFCKRGNHFMGMGDLYGPYFVKNDAPNNISGHTSTGRTEVTPDAQEVWFHETCISWASNVYLVGRKLRNLDEAIWDSSQNSCVWCKLKGAHMACISRGCTQMYHFLCAHQAECHLDHETFSISCHKHKSQHETPSVSDSLLLI